MTDERQAELLAENAALAAGAHVPAVDEQDPWQWLHDNEFSWDDVNAIAAVLDAGGFDIMPSGSLSGEDRLAKALVDSGLMKRYSDYANSLPTMRHGDPEELAREWAHHVAKAYERQDAGLCGAILNCALPTNHEGIHERADGIRWSWHENIDHLPTPASERQAGLRGHYCLACHDTPCRYVVAQVPAQEERLNSGQVADALWNAFSTAAHAEHESDECDTCRWYRTLAVGDSERFIAEYRALGVESKEDGS